MTKARITIALCLALVCAGAQSTFAQMTDDQVVKYVQQANKQGKSQSEISRELLSRGVTMDQVNRLKEKYSGELKDNASDSGHSVKNARSLRKAVDNVKSSSDVSQFEGNTVGNAVLRDLENSPELVAASENRPLPVKSKIFGHDMFSSSGTLSFEPNENIATPENYKLGPGDEVIIEIWGFNEANIAETISPEGKINISQVGPVYLSGLTVNEASKKIKKVLLSKYSSIGGDQPNSDVSVTLGQIRTIQVNVMGEVAFPGSYRLSSFSTVFTALYRSGGVTDNGTLRAIRVYRDGKQFAEVDVYGYLLNGKSESDVRLQDGDIIIVSPYVNIVTIEGGVKRPMQYEMAKGETLADLLNFAGGFTGEAFKDNVRVVRVASEDRMIFTVSAADAASCVLEDADVITIDSSVKRYANRVAVSGYVRNPGEYELGSAISTVKQLVEAAGGLLEDAFLGRAVLRRQNEDYSYSMQSVNVGAIVKGTAADVKLANNDELVVAGIYEINQRGTLTINGMVVNPGVFDYAENTTVEDLIVLAGGLLDGASMSKVDVSRRVADPYGTEISETIGESYSFAIKDGLAVDGADTFYLKPYDVVSVRKSPSFQNQQFVTVSGEVSFPGQYVLQTNGERISSVIERAGGPTYLAFIKGGKLTRRMTEEELATARETLENERRNIQRQKERLALSQGTSAVVDADDLETMQVSSIYTVAVDFEQALANPGSAYDIILREGDVLTIPENVGTVAIKGEVLYPNNVAFIQGKPVSYYISQAGGFNNDAKSSKVYVVYMNGSVAKGSGAKVEPGCEIVVPRKPERKQMSTAEIMSLGTSTASLGTMIVSLVNMLSK